uniref:Uncharacterized protein n=1 Tax=uncultured prokaryote TaxID=198431 RepID=A0A0H5PZF5_9ZZZZ|nr:hypothetical protein [uncultured prokaryote]
MRNLPTNASNILTSPKAVKERFNALTWLYAIQTEYTPGGDHKLTNVYFQDPDSGAMYHAAVTNLAKDENLIDRITEALKAGV